MKQTREEPESIAVNAVEHVHRTLSAISTVWQRERKEHANVPNRAGESAHAAGAAESGAARWEELRDSVLASQTAYEQAKTLTRKPTEQWAAAMSAYSEGERALLCEALAKVAAEARVDGNDAARAKDIASFAVTYIRQLPDLLPAKATRAFGRAWFEFAAAHYALGDVDAADAACDWAVSNLQDPAFMVDQSYAQMLRARVWIAKGYRSAPVLLLCNCARTFVTWGVDHETAIEALGIVAELLCEAQRWSDARETLAVADRLALDDDDVGRFRMRFDEALRRCVARGYRIAPSAHVP